jgi:hypothetical protein
MVVLAVPRFVQLLAAAWALVACSSGPELKRSLTVKAGESTIVRCVQVSGTRAFSLRNSSAQGSTEVYTANSNEIDPDSKVVADVNLQTLLDVFATKGMFETSVGEVPAGSIDALIVEQGKRRWVWAVSGDKRARLAAVQRGDRSEQTFSEARQEFYTLYNSTMAFHGTGGEKPDFKAENARVKAENSDIQHRGHR